MLLITSALMKPKLEFTRLSDSPGHRRWVEEKWGTISNNLGSRDWMDRVYIGTYGAWPVAMFAFRPFKFHEDSSDLHSKHKLYSVFKLMYVYVEDDYRGLGFGRQIIDVAKRVAKNVLKADLILTDTLPVLNRMYEKQGANWICEDHLTGTDVLAMKI